MLHRLRQWVCILIVVDAFVIADFLIRGTHNPIIAIIVSLII